MPDLSVDVQQNGVPLGTLTLSGSAQEIEFTCVNRLTAFVQLIAYDTAGASVAFTYSNLAGGIYIRVPAGGGINLPVSGTQSWFFIEDTSSTGSELQLSCAG